MEAESIFASIKENIEGRICVTPDEADLIIAAVKDSDLHVEIGCLWGGTSILAALAGAKKVYTIDPMAGGYWDKGDPDSGGKKPSVQAILANFAAFGVADRIQAIRSSSRPWPLIAMQPDTIFIDGDHSYEGCLADWTVATKIAKRAVLVHDVDERHPGVIRVINEHANKTPCWRLAERRDFTVCYERIPSPIVSVIIPTFNRPEFLERALESIDSQTMDDGEMSVANDGKLEVDYIVERFPKARLCKHKKGGGPAAARNSAIKEAKGYYIAYLDDDDWYYINHLETLIGAIAGSGARLVYADAHCDEREAATRRVYISRDANREELLKRSLFPTCGVLHERSLYDEVGVFDESLPNHEDYDLWLRISHVTELNHVPVVTSVIDRTRRTMNSDKAAMKAAFELVRARYAE